MEIETRGLRVGEDNSGGWIKSTKEPDSKSALNTYGVIIDVKLFKISVGFTEPSIWFR